MSNGQYERNENMKYEKPSATGCHAADVGLCLDAKATLQFASCNCGSGGARVCYDAK